MFPLKYVAPSMCFCIFLCVLGQWFPTLGSPTVLELQFPHIFTISCADQVFWELLSNNIWGTKVGNNCSRVNSFPTCVLVWEVSITFVWVEFTPSRTSHLRYTVCCLWILCISGDDFVNLCICGCVPFKNTVCLIWGSSHKIYCYFRKPVLVNYNHLSILIQKEM